MHRASISTPISLATFARGAALLVVSSQFFHHYSLRGDAARPCGLHARLCYAFLVKKMKQNYSIRCN